MAWSRKQVDSFIARPLSRTWTGKLQPVMSISSSRLIVGAGSNIYSYSFGSSNNSSASPPIISEGSVSLIDHRDQPRNITALTFVEDGGLDSTLDVAFQDGAIERVILTSVGKELMTKERTKTILMPNNDFVESISCESNITLSLSSNGYVRLSNSSGDMSLIELKSRSWASQLCLQSSTPYAVFGTSSTTPLTIHELTEGQLSSNPTVILHTSKASGGTVDLPLEVDKLPSSAVYGIARGPLNSPWGASPQIVVSGWYDGQVRCYDLRASCSRISSKSNPSLSSSRSLLRPVLSLLDKWSYEPIYSVACGGGSAAHIAAGTARHSVVSFWDVRSPRTSGWSIHGPGNDPSPVYSVVLESSRFFGVTQSRPFVYDFVSNRQSSDDGLTSNLNFVHSLQGPGVSLDTYPPIPKVRGIDNLKQKKGTHHATYHVLGYSHNSSGLGDI